MVDKSVVAERSEKMIPFLFLFECFKEWLSVVLICSSVANCLYGPFFKTKCLEPRYHPSHPMLTADFESDNPFPIII